MAGEDRVFRDAAGWRDINWTNGEVCEEFRTSQDYWEFWLVCVSHFLTGFLGDTFPLGTLTTADEEGVCVRPRPSG